MVAVPVRGAGCIDQDRNEEPVQRFVAVPVRGAGCIETEMEKVLKPKKLLSP